MSTIKTIPIEEITLDDRTQQRAGELDENIIDEYADELENGKEFTPIVVYCDDEKTWLADGHYRYFAAKKAEKSVIDAEIRSGTLDDAVLYSCGANGNHGLRRTRADICKAVATIKAHPVWSQWSNRQVAQTCNVSHTFVNNWEKKYGGNVSAPDIGEHDHEPATGPAFAPEDKPESEEPIKPRPPRDTCKAGELDSLIDLLQEAYDLAVALKDDQIAVAVGNALNLAKGVL
jgi:hypothetical protein